MKNLIYIFLLISFFSFSQKEKRLALVIGNSEYIKGPLKNPVNDASLIAATLEGLDFEVMLYKNLKTRASMLKAISEFGQKRPLYDVGFIYYAGHGIQVNNENFLIPTDELINNKLEVEDYAVSLQKILRYLESSGVSNNINFLVLDACRDNPYEMSWSRSSKGNGLAKTPPPTGSLIAFSTDSNQTAADGDGENSLYSLSLSKNLTKENISIEQVFKNVLTEVLDESENTQSPVYESKLTGSTYALNRTFSVYNSTSQEIIDFTDKLLNKGSLLDALKILDDAANYFKSEKEIKNEIKIRLKIVQSYLFYESQKEINIQSESFDRFDFNFNTIAYIRAPTLELFDDLFDKSSYDIFISNYTYLLSNNKKDYLEKINYKELFTLAYFYNYQMTVLIANNDDIDFSKGMILNPPSLIEIERFIKKNKINIKDSPLLSFWRSKNDYLKFRQVHYSEIKLISSLDELNDALKNYSLAIINQIKEVKLPDLFTSESEIINKTYALTIDKYPNLNQEKSRSITDVIDYSNNFNIREFYELFTEENKELIEVIKIIDSPEFFISDYKNKIKLDINWFLNASSSLYNSLIFSFGPNDKAVIEIIQIIKNIQNVLTNHDLILDELLTSKDKEKIDRYNNFVKANTFRTSAFLNYRDYNFSTNDIEIDSLFTQKVNYLKEVNSFMSDITSVNDLAHYSSVIDKDFDLIINYINDFENYPGRDDYAFYYSLIEYVKSSVYTNNKNSMNTKMYEYEKKLKLNDIIKKVLLVVQSKIEDYSADYLQFVAIDMVRHLDLYKNLSDISEFRSDEYLILNYFIFKNIITVDEKSTFIWDFFDINRRFNELINIADSNDDYLFKINIQQTFDEFVNNIDYSLYNKLYTDDQLVQIEDIVSSY